MKLKIAQAIGLNTDQKAAQVTSEVRDDPSGPLRTSITFLAVINLSSDDAFTKGRQALSELEDFFFESEGGAAEKLKAAFAEAESKFSDEWDLILAAISGKVLYFIRKGDGGVYLKRADKLSLLSAGIESQLVSGFLQDSDKLLLSTGSLVAFLGEDLEKSLNLPIEVFKEEMESKIGTSELENQGLAALAVEVMEENAEISSLEQDKQAKIQVPLKTILRSYFPKSNRGRLIVAVILIAVIASGAGYQYKVSRDAKIQAEFNQLLGEAKDNFNKAKGLANLNPADAKDKLDISKDKVGKALVLMPKNLDADNLRKQIEQESSLILQQSRVADFPEVLDLDLVKKDFRASQMSLSKDKLLVMDPDTKTLVMVDIAKKSHQILAGAEKLGDAALAALNGGLAFIYSKDKGILRVDTVSSKLSVVAKKDEELGDIKDIYGFAGNVYLLDLGQVWKYLPTSDGYSAKREYLSKGIKADFSNALRMQIESSIYVLKSGGEILRFTKGEKDNFSYSGLPTGVKDPKSFFVSSDTDNLYLLDSGNSRLLILTKTGSYKGEITGSKFATATDLVVDEAGKKVYLLEGSKIFQADLK